MSGWYSSFAIALGLLAGTLGHAEALAQANSGFWGPVVRPGVAASAPREPAIQKQQPEIAGLRLGTPSIAAKRLLRLNEEPPLLVNELTHDEVPGSYGLMAYDMSPACRTINLCRVRMRVLFSRAKVWFIAREYLEGPFAKHSIALERRQQISQELALHYGALTIGGDRADDKAMDVHVMYSAQGARVTENSECLSVQSIRVVGLEPLSFPRSCGWSFRQALSLVQIDGDYYVQGVLQLADLDQPYPEMTEPRARQGDARATFN